MNQAVLPNDTAKPESGAFSHRMKEILSRPTFICLSLALITTFVYRHVVAFDFISYDDPLYFSENARVLRGLSWSNVIWTFHTADAASWYPLMWLSFMTDVTLFGKSAAGPHFVNLLFHVANTLLLFLLLRKITGKTWRGALVAALFALHPLHVESVAWIAERKDVLSTFFGLLSLWMYADGKYRFASFRPANRSYWWSFVFFILALLSKPMQVTLPCVMLLLDFWPLKRTRYLAFWQLVREKILFFVASVAFGVVTLWVHEKSDTLAPLADVSILARVQNALVAYFGYLEKTLWPVDLMLPYFYNGLWPAGITICAMLSLTGVSVVAVWKRIRWPFLFVGWFWFLGTLFPVIGIIKWGSQSMADRFTYVPLIGLFIAAVWGMGAIIIRWRIPVFASLATATAVIVASAARTFDQVSYWQNSETLFRHTLALSPKNFIAFYGLGYYYASEGHLDEAIVEYKQALILAPVSPTILQNIGSVWFRKKNYEIALYFFRLAADAKPQDASIHSAIGDALVELKKHSDATAEYETALRLDPSCARAHAGLGNILSETGSSSEAIAQYQEALRLDPDSAQAHYGLANLLFKTGKTAEAVQMYQIALQEQPDFAEAENNFGAVLLQLGRVDEAIAHFRNVIQFHPDHANAHANLGNALAMRGNLADALTEFEQAVRIAPDSVEARFGLGVLLARLGRRNEAVTNLSEALRLDPNCAGAQQMLEKLGAISNSIQP